MNEELFNRIFVGVIGGGISTLIGGYILRKFIYNGEVDSVASNSGKIESKKFVEPYSASTNNEDSDTEKSDIYKIYNEKEVILKQLKFNNILSAEEFNEKLQIIENEKKEMIKEMTAKEIKINDECKNRKIKEIINSHKDMQSIEQSYKLGVLDKDEYMKKIEELYVRIEAQMNQVFENPAAFLFDDYVFSDKLSQVQLNFLYKNKLNNTENIESVFLLSKISKSLGVYSKIEWQKIIEDNLQNEYYYVISVPQ